MAKTKYMLRILLLYWNSDLSFFRVVFKKITTKPTKGAFGFQTCDTFIKQFLHSFTHGLVVEICQI